MPRIQEKGSILLILLLILFIAGGAAIFLTYKFFSVSTTKIAQNTEALKVELEEEYENPFDAETQYENPFNEYQNPFEVLAKESNE